MNNERREQLMVFVRFLFVFGFAALYAWGGIENKWLRRFVAPAELSLGMFLFSRDWRVFLQTPLMMITLSFGYGADVIWIKVLKRLLWGAANGFSSSLYIFISALRNNHLWVLFGLQTSIIVLSVIILGVFNPLPSARAEEFTIGVLIALIPMMSAKQKI